MIEAPQLAEEEDRCAALHSLDILDTPAEERFDRVTRLAQQLFDVPIVLVSLVDSERQWFKSRQGLDATETPRSISFCGHAVAADAAFVIEDTLLDERFADNPLVTGEPHIRFYAGQPLRLPAGQRVGTLCMIDRKPRKLDGEQRNCLRDLALLIEAELRRDLPPSAVPRGDPAERRRRPRRKTLEMPWRRAASRTTSRWWAAIPALLSAAAVFIGGAIWDQQQLEAYRAEQEKAAVQTLSLLRGELESVLNAKLHLVNSLSGYLRAGGQIQTEAFDQFAGELAHSVGSVRSLQLAPDGVVTYVWPLEGNRGAIGHDLMGDAARRAAAQLAIDNRTLWLAGPLNLIQGGVALIGRQPIFVPDAGNPSGERFWGFATILIDMPGLLAEVGLVENDGRYRYGIRGRDALGSTGEVFFGTAALFAQDPMLAQITLPAGSWEMAVAPTEGWPTSRPDQWQFRTVVFFMAQLIGSLVYFLLRLPASLQQAVASATSALERNESRFRDAIEALPDGFVIYDANDRLALCNERLRELYAASRPRLQPGRAYAEILRYGMEHGQFSTEPPTDPVAVEEAMQQFVERHRAAAASYEEELANGTTLRVIERRMRDGGVVSFHMDVTEQKAAQVALVEARERAEQANQAKSAFLATVSHEVRTPLNGVLGLLGVLLEDPGLNEQQNHYLKTAHQSARHLLEILNEILDLSKLEADKLELDVGSFRLADTLRSAVELIAAQAQTKGLELRTEIAPGLHGVVIGDEGRLRQVLLNLLSNAVKFTDSGWVVLKARPVDPIDGVARVCIEVQDSGIGFSPEQAEQLFEAFSQLDSDANRRFTGTGLGLPICRRLVGLMGGTITASAQPGEGSTFTLNLPFKLGAERDLQAEGEVARAPLPVELGWPTVRVLLAEDSPTNQMVIQAMLQNTGYSVDAVHNGVEAVEAVRSLPYDLVLMDVYMPEMDGLTATRTIRQDPDLPALPIIALTANAMEGDSERFLQAGMDDYLPKPVSKNDLLAALHRQYCRVRPEAGRSQSASHTSSSPTV